MVDITIKFDERGFADLTQALGLTEKRIEAAAYRAVRKTAAWVKTRLARTLSKELQILQKIIRQRLRIYMDDSDALKVKMWIGMNAIHASRLGRARKTRTGITVGRHRFPGSFQATMKTGHTGIYHRRGRKRLHIDVTKLDVNEQAEKAAREIGRDVEVRLMEIMHQEINTEIRRSKINVN